MYPITILNTKGNFLEVIGFASSSLHVDALEVSQPELNIQELLDSYIDVNLLDASQQNTQPDELYQRLASQLLYSETSPPSNFEPDYLAIDFSNVFNAPQQQSQPGATSEQQSTAQHIPSSQEDTPEADQSGESYILNFIDKPETFGDITQWTQQEIRDGRRIIKFDFTKVDRVLNIQCCPINSEDYRETMLTISCVYWYPNPAGELQHKSAGGCIFTSVDVINVIAQLADKLKSDRAVDIKEKNRIRRNLEVLGPQTVKKEGVTLQFFNQLMGYSSPKTRNIEKDIKVFQWHNISTALKKVMHQYKSKNTETANASQTTPVTDVQTFQEDDTQFLSEFDQSEFLDTFVTDAQIIQEDDSQFVSEFDQSEFMNTFSSDFGLLEEWQQLDGQPMFASPVGGVQTQDAEDYITSPTIERGQQ